MILKLNQHETDSFAASTTEVEPGKKIVQFLDEDPTSNLQFINAPDPAVIGERQSARIIDIEIELSQSTLNKLGDSMDEVKDAVGAPDYLEEPLTITVTRDGSGDVTLIDMDAGAKFVFRFKPSGA